jgi:hypothetical protein
MRNDQVIYHHKIRDDLRDSSQIATNASLNSSTFFDQEGKRSEDIIECMKITKESVPIPNYDDFCSPLMRKHEHLQPWLSIPDFPPPSSSYKFCFIILLIFTPNLCQQRKISATLRDVENSQLPHSAKPSRALGDAERFSASRFRITEIAPCKLFVLNR